MQKFLLWKVLICQKFLTPEISFWPKTYEWVLNTSYCYTTVISTQHFQTEY